MFAFVVGIICEFELRYSRQVELVLNDLFGPDIAWTSLHCIVSKNKILFKIGPKEII
jgi:hypothetical protein